MSAGAEEKCTQSFPPFLSSPLVGLQSADAALCSLAFKLSQFVPEVSKPDFVVSFLRSPSSFRDSIMPPFLYYIDGSHDAHRQFPDIINCVDNIKGLYFFTKSWITNIPSQDSLSLSVPLFSFCSS